MSSTIANDPSMGRAESAFRAAFERLKANTPQLLAKNTPVTQNNVAREAGLDPSALKKARFPSLVAEIQNWIGEHGSSKPQSAKQELLSQRSRSRDLRQRLEDMKTQRDHALSLLVEADAYILSLLTEIDNLKAGKGPTNIVQLRNDSKHTN